MQQCALRRQPGRPNFGRKRAKFIFFSHGSWCQSQGSGRHKTTIKFCLTCKLHVVQHRGMDLRDKLKANGYRQRDLAQRLGVSESNVSRWFAWVVDKRQGTPIPSEALAVISEMTGVEPEVLVAAVAREIAA